MSTKKGRRAAFSIITALMATAFMFSLCIGKFPISIGEIFSIIVGRPESQYTADVFFGLRLSRTVMVFLSGFGLGMAGNIYQSIFRNPLADPDIIGVVKGANLGAAVAIITMGNQIVGVAASAFAGGLLAVLAVMVLVRLTRMNSTAVYVLAGIVISAVAEALIMILKFFADPDKELAAIEFWAMGSFGRVTSDKVAVVAPILLVSIAALCLLRRQITMLSIDEDESRMLGVQVAQVRLIILALNTLIVASIICVTGRIAFLGLIAPHIGRLVFGRAGFATTLFSACVGSVILTLADCAARVAYSTELPISVVTTAVGVPFLVYFMCKRREVRL